MVEEDELPRVMIILRSRICYLRRINIAEEDKSLIVTIKHDRWTDMG